MNQEVGEQLEELQQKIGIAFGDLSLLRAALTHSSYANENPEVAPQDNERLEYLGDAVLQLISAEYLYKTRPEAKEGELTQVRSAMVNTVTLAALSEELGLGDHLSLGKGIAKGGGRALPSVLANTFEAVLGAIFLDAGYDAAFHYCMERFEANPEAFQQENFKGRLQQVVQGRFGVTPTYECVGSRGRRDRLREYTAVVYATDQALGTGHGQTKQNAEQAAASVALQRLMESDDPPPSPPPVTVEESKPKPRRRSRRGAAKTGDSAPQTDTAEGSSTPPPLLPQKGGGIYGIEESEPDSGRSRQLGEPVG